jgi:hypothetical protein
MPLEMYQLLTNQRVSGRELSTTKMPATKHATSPLTAANHRKFNAKGHFAAYT